MADANIPARHILAPRVRAVGACPYLLPFNWIFTGLLGCYNLLETENTATGQGCKFAVSVGRPRVKTLSASGGGGFVSLTPDQGLCPWTLLGLCPQTPVIGSRSALAMSPPKSKFWIRLCRKKHFNHPKCDFWRGLGGLEQFSRLPIARHILGPPHKLYCNSTTGHTRKHAGAVSPACSILCTRD